MYQKETCKNFPLCLFLQKDHNLVWREKLSRQWLSVTVTEVRYRHRTQAIAFRIGDFRKVISKLSLQRGEKKLYRKWHRMEETLQEMSPHGRKLYGKGHCMEGNYGKGTAWTENLWGRALNDSKENGKGGAW